MLGSAKTNLPLLTFTSWVKEASPFPPLAMYHFQLSVIFRCFREKCCIFLGKSAWLTTSSWYPGSQDQPFPQPWMQKAQWFPAVRALDIFSIFQQSSTATKYPDELTEIFKTLGIIQLVSGRVKSFSRCKEGGGRWLLDAHSQPNTKLIAAQLRTYYAISLAIGQLPTYQRFEGGLEFFTESVPTICFSIIGTT